MVQAILQNSQGKAEKSFEQTKIEKPPLSNHFVTNDSLNNSFGEAILTVAGAALAAFAIYYSGQYAIEQLKNWNPQDLANGSIDTAPAPFQDTQSVPDSFPETAEMIIEAKMPGDTTAVAGTHSGSDMEGTCPIVPGVNTKARTYNPFLKSNLGIGIVSISFGFVTAFLLVKSISP